MKKLTFLRGEEFYKTLKTKTHISKTVSIVKRYSKKLERSFNEELKTVIKDIWCYLYNKSWCGFRLFGRVYFSILPVLE